MENQMAKQFLPELSDGDLYCLLRPSCSYIYIGESFQDIFLTQDLQEIQQQNTELGL